MRCTYQVVNILDVELDLKGTCTLYNFKVVFCGVTFTSFNISEILKKKLKYSCNDLASRIFVRCTLGISSDYTQENSYYFDIVLT